MSASTLHPDQSVTDRSLGDLLRDLSDGTAQLVRQELRLARIETAESLHRLGGGAAKLAAGLVVAIGAMGAAVACIILALSRYALGGLTWLSALIVAVVLAVVAALLARAGAHALSLSSLVPDETTSSLKETAEWLKHPTTSDASSKRPASA